MFTLLSSVLGGHDWTEYTDALQVVDWIYKSLFTLFVLLTQLAVLNVITGIFVDSSMNAALNDKQTLIQEEMVRQGMHKIELEQLFMEADTALKGRVREEQLAELFFGCEGEDVFEGNGNTLHCAKRHYEQFETRC